MNRNNSRMRLVAGAALALGILAAATQPAVGQTQGYAVGTPILWAFDPSNGVLLSSLSPNFGGLLAVSSGGASLYIPQISSQDPNLGVLSASDFQVTSTIPGLAPDLSATKVILDPTGTYAFVMCAESVSTNAVAVVNLAKQAVVGYIHVVGGNPVDIAITPNGKQLFVSTMPASTDSKHLVARPDAISDVQQTVYDCKAVPGICAYNTVPFASAGTVSTVSGYLAVSKDSSMLYAIGDGTTDGYFAAISTSTLKPSTVALGSEIYPFAIAVAPTGTQAVVLVSNRVIDESYFLLLDTSTNQIIGDFPSHGVTSTTKAGSNVIAFSPDGSSLWTLAGCYDPDCEGLTGLSFPSGNIIADTSLGSNARAYAIVF
jgi:DNA-binding beta-propeller fold protein YncE